MAFRAEHPEAYVGRTVGTGHCVAYVRECSAAPHTSQWRPGFKARMVPVSALPGAVIATFSDGVYGNHLDGRSHAAVLVSIGVNGSLVVFDQWKGQPVHQRVIRSKGGKGMPCDDADAYHVVEVA
jgi:hypothetical protein